MYVVLSIPLLTSIAVFFFNAQPPYLASIILFFIAPSFFLSLKEPAAFRRALTFSLLFCLPVGLLMDFSGTSDHAWYVPVSLFSTRIFGRVPVEDLIWVSSCTFSMILFYEHFSRPRSPVPPAKRTRLLPLFSLLLISTFLAIATRAPAVLEIPYAYLWFGIALCILPPAIFLGFHRSHIKPFLKLAGYGFYSLALFEAVGLKSHHWGFPGTHFIAKFSVFGWQLPVEEIVFLLIFGPAAAASFYELFYGCGRTSATSP